MVAETLERPVGPGAQVTALRGVHHLALNTDDMKATVDFYQDVLGMPLIHAMRVPPGLGTGDENRGNPPFENLRHYFFDMGNDSLLAFFEIPKGAKAKGDRDAIAAMQHVAFAATSENAEKIRARLKDNDIDVDGPIEALEGVFSTYFYDPNGIRLEMTEHPEDGDNVQIVDKLMQTRDVAKPELESLGSDPHWAEYASRNMC